MAAGAWTSHDPAVIHPGLRYGGAVTASPQAKVPTQSSVSMEPMLEAYYMEQPRDGYLHSRPVAKCGGSFQAWSFFSFLSLVGSSLLFPRSFYTWLSPTSHSRIMPATASVCFHGDTVRGPHCQPSLTMGGGNFDLVIPSLLPIAT